MQRVERARESEAAIRFAGGKTFINYIKSVFPLLVPPEHAELLVIGKVFLPAM